MATIDHVDHIRNGVLITIDGLDGSGKATQAMALHNSMSNSIKVSFPDYESDSSALVKMYLNGEFGSHPDDVNAYAASSFYAVDRYASYKKDWESHYLNAGIVICDRYTTSNAIHQCAKLPESEWDTFLSWLFHFEYELLGIPKPDITIYLKVDPDVSQKLLMVRYEGDASKKDIHEADLNYLKRSQKAAQYCAEKYGWTVIDCCENGEMRSVTDIHMDVTGAVVDHAMHCIERTAEKIL